MKKEDKLAELLDHSTALQDAMRFIYQHDQNNPFRFAGYKTFMRKYNSLAQKALEYENMDDIVDLFNLKKVPGSMNTTTIQQKDLFDSVLANLSILVSILSTKVKIKESKIQDLRNFLRANLRRAVMNNPNKEKDIQDIIEQLLIGRGLQKGLDYDREKGRVKVSMKEVIPDFIFPKFDLALEIKLSKNSQKAKTIIDEINADIRSYSKIYKNILFIIYDFSTIRDEEEFKADIDNKENILVSIIKH